MAGEWYFQVMGQELGPLTAAELKSKVMNGQIQRDTLVRKGHDGKWIFGGEIKGLFAPAPVPVSKPQSVPAKSTTSAPGGNGQIPQAVGRDSSPSQPVKARANASDPARFPTSIPVADSISDDNQDESPSPLLEFYDFVGFREAISPALYDAIKQYASERGISLGQLNRRALAQFIQRPELASHLLIKSFEGIPRHVNEKHHPNDSLPQAGRDKDEVATFRVSLFNCGHDSIHLTEGAFVPSSVEPQSYDVVTGQVASIDHSGHIPIKLRPLCSGKSIRLTLDETIPAQSSRDLVFWFYGEEKTGLTNVTGQLQLGSGADLAISDFFTIVLHGDSPGHVHS